MKKIYICHTYYHVYITVVKEIKNKGVSDILISDAIIGYEILYKRLVASKIFNNVYILKEGKIEEGGVGVKHFIRYRQHLKILVNIEVPCDLKKYENRYIYNDSTRIGYYLMVHRLKYHLIEDGLNCYKNENQLINLNYDWKWRIKSQLNIPLTFGQSKYVIDIEVNDREDIKIKHKKVVVVSRIQLINKLNQEEKKEIYQIFIRGSRAIQNKHAKQVLILTQPLYQDHLLASEGRQIEIYKEIAEKYLKQAYEVTIKPHPRDNIEYMKYIEGVKLIEGQVPIEIFNFSKEFKFNKVVTISSTAIDAIDFAEKKEKLGIEWINNRS